MLCKINEMNTIYCIIILKGIKALSVFQKQNHVIFYEVLHNCLSYFKPIFYVFLIFFVSVMFHLGNRCTSDFFISQVYRLLYFPVLPSFGLLLQLHYLLFLNLMKIRVFITFGFSCLCFSLCV